MPKHGPAGDWTCICGYDYFGGSIGYSNALYAAHLDESSKSDSIFANTGLAYSLFAVAAFLFFVALFR